MGFFTVKPVHLRQGNGGAQAAIAAKFSEKGADVAGIRLLARARVRDEIARRRREKRARVTDAELVAQRNIADEIAKATAESPR